MVAPERLPSASAVLSPTCEAWPIPPGAPPLSSGKPSALIPESGEAQANAPAPRSVSPFAPLRLAAEAGPAGGGGSFRPLSQFSHRGTVNLLAACSDHRCSQFPSSNPPQPARGDARLRGGSSVPSGKRAQRQPWAGPSAGILYWAHQAQRPQDWFWLVWSIGGVQVEMQTGAVAVGLHNVLLLRQTLHQGSDLGGAGPGQKGARSVQNLLEPYRGAHVCSAAVEVSPREEALNIDALRWLEEAFS